jgi:hypothetical protein
LFAKYEGKGSRLSSGYFKHRLQFFRSRSSLGVPGQVGRAGEILLLFESGEMLRQNELFLMAESKAAVATP